MRIARALSASARAIAWRIHHVAYVENLKAPAVIELLRRAHQSERPLLNQIQERQPLVSIVLRDRDDEAQVGLDHLLLGVEIAALDPLGETDLLLRCQQTHLGDVLHQQLKGIGRHVRLQIERRLRLAPPALLRRALKLRRSERRIDLLDQLDRRPLQKAVQLFDVCLVQIELRDRPGNLGESQDPELPSAIHQPLELIKLLKIR